MAEPHTFSPETLEPYEADFIRILNNEAKHRPELKLPVRQRGFMVLVRGADNLRPLQSLCLKQPYNHCFTARYRLQPQAAVGTLLSAFANDINDIDYVKPDPKKKKGDFAPSLDEWQTLLDREKLRSSHDDAEYARRLFEGAREFNLNIESTEAARQMIDDFEISDELPGYLTLAQVLFILTVLGDVANLKTGSRLVIFGELSEPAINASEWELARQIFRMLPERMGLVLSGAPRDFTLPKNDPHFLEISVPEKAAEDDADATVDYKFTDSSFHRDQPATRDDLDVNDYANALARFILHKQTMPPLTIGIHGPWGKGKSSFMQLVAGALVGYAEVNNSSGSAEQSRTQQWSDLVTKLARDEPEIQALRNERKHFDEQKEKEKQARIAAHEEDQKLETVLRETMQAEADRQIIQVWFNAWQFEDAKQTWAGLASQISEGMEAALPWHYQQLLKIKYAWKERKAELALNILLPLAIVLIVAGLFSLGGFQKVILPEKTEGALINLLRLLLPAGSALLTIWFLSSQLIKVAEPISERVLTYVRMPNYRDQMGFQHRVKDDLRFVHDFLVDHRKDIRVVVYIDDLDRCSEGKIIEILQAINLILANCKFFVFVGMDTEMIYRAIRSYYRDNVPERFPENYLRKIIQISFYLPESSVISKAAYLNSLFSWNARFGVTSKPNGDQQPVKHYTPPPPARASASGDLPYDLNLVLPIVRTRQQDVEDTPDELKAFHDYVGFLADNPRGIKRLVNLHRLIKILLQQRGARWSRPYQRKLVKWLVFCDVWPQFVDDVLSLRKKRDVRADELKGTDARTPAPEELEMLDKESCLGTLVANLKGSAKYEDAYLSRLTEFTGLNEEDTLTVGDVNQDFRLAAYLSQLVIDSPETQTAPPTVTPEAPPPDIQLVSQPEAPTIK